MTAIEQMLAKSERQVAYHQQRGKHYGPGDPPPREEGSMPPSCRRPRSGWRSSGPPRPQPASWWTTTERPSLPRRPQEPIRAGIQRPVGRQVTRAVATFLLKATFDAADVARVVNQHYGASLRKRFDARATSVTLPRLTATGHIHLVQKGTPHHLALYSRARPGAVAAR